VSTGAQNDLQRATEIARAMVLEYGMGETLGPVTFPRQHPMFLPEQSAYRSQGMREYSEATAQALHMETKNILEERQEYVRQLLSEKRFLFDRLAKLLLEQEVVEGEEFEEIVAQSQKGVRV
jgi:cell division protease FtsH